MKKFFIIDGNAYIHRAYHALPPLSAPNNQQINAVYGFIKLLMKIRNNFKPDYIAVCFDYPAKNFRHQIYQEYKAHRKPLDEALISQMPIAREAVKALNIADIEIENYEADDLIATVSAHNKKNGIYTVIVTGDKDILQLVEDDKIAVWSDSKDIMYDEKKVEERYGVLPNQLTDVFALMGDASDNVPGIKGIGEKTAVKFIKEFGSLENVLNNADSIKGNSGKLVQNGKESALLSKKLVELKTDIPIDYKAEKFISKDMDISKALPFFEKYEFKSFINQYINSDIKDESDEKAKYSSNIINSKEDALKLSEIIKNERSFAFKTVGNSNDPLKSHIVGISFYCKEKAYYIPLGHNDFTVWQLDINDFKSIFKDIFISEKIKKIGYDLKYERNVFKSKGIELKGIYFDIMLASYCLDPSKSNSISNISKEYLNFNAADDSFLGKGAKKINIEDASIKNVADFLNSVSYASYNIYTKLEEKIKSEKLYDLFYNIEMPLLSVLSDMEIAGIKIDSLFLEKFNDKIVGEIKSIEQKIYSLAGEEFNINSPKQLSVIMFEKLNLPIIKKTKTGYSTDEEVLKELSSYELPAEVLKYRELQKLKSTYIDPIGNYCQYYGDRIHTVFNQAITTTGRLSSTDPNLQNIPIKSEYGREFRKAFIPEKDKIFISADYSQIDLRVLAHISEDERLIEAFKAREDIHSATAREVFGIAKNEKVPDNLRSDAKAINFGIVYGMSPFGLSKQLNISFIKAREYIDNYFDRYKGVKKWMGEIVDNAKQEGFVKTITGRVRYIPELRSSNAQIRAAGERIAMNTPIQGTSADIIKIAMIDIYNDLKKDYKEVLMLLQVHDDLLFEVPENIANDIAELIKDKMENALKLKVPLIVDIKTGKNWGEMKK